MARSGAFRDFVFTAYSRRITDLFRVIDDVAFGRIDVRLAGRLVALAAGHHEIRVTHQQLATELGTAREVVFPTDARISAVAAGSASRAAPVVVEDSAALETLASA